MKLFVLFAVLSISLNVFGGTEHFSSRISGSEIAVNASFGVVDDKYLDMKDDPSGWSSVFTNYKVSNKITVGLNPSVKQQVTFNGQVAIQVVYEVWNALTLTFDEITVNRTLSIEYNTNEYQQIKDRTSFVFEGAHRMKVKITGLTNVEEESIFIEGHIDIERYYFDGGISVSDLKATPYPFTVSPFPFSDPSNEFIDLSWDFYPGAESYELEYVHINDYTLSSGVYKSASEIPFSYYLNSTRVELLANYYRIPNIYDHGYFIFRVRPVMRGGNDYSKKITTDHQWSAPESGMIGIHHPSSQIVFIGREYHGGMNWSHQVSFTEEGKRFESVSFADGLGRGRQSVARNTATDQIVISNVYFDDLGRGVIADLPTPVDLSYPVHHPNFNRADVFGFPSFNNSNFDDPLTSDGVCLFDQYGMSNLYGASRYYSSQNPNQDGANGTIPDAENFPYSRVHYLNDFTGRVDRVASAGGELTMGNGHETNYIYVTASQPELYQIFGEEVGDATHYQKLVTIDPNGQVYVQYTDMAGRVVVSYMMGPSPSSLEELEGTATEELTFPIMVDGSGQIPDYTNVSAELTYTQYFAEDNESYDVEYAFTPQQYQSICNEAPICFDCVYELELRIEEKCGDVIHNSSIVVNGNDLDHLCSVAANYNQSFTLFIPKGEYTFTKVLKVNQKAIDEYWCMHIDNITDACLTPLNVLFNGLYENESFPECDDEEYLTEYDTAKDCDLIKLLMAGDISPGGQYARYTVTGGVYSASDPTSIFFGTTPPYTTFGFGPITVLDPITNTLVSPAALRLENYILLFDPAWATYLIENEPDAHPESCMLGYCDANASSETYDEGMWATQTFSNAITYSSTNQRGGYFLPIDFLIAPTTGIVASYFGTNFSNCDMHEDPFFAPGGMGATYATDMENKMKTYISLIGGDTPCPLSIWEYSVLTAILTTNTTISIERLNCSQIRDLISNSNDECLNDLIWIIYRQAYQDLKQNYIFNANDAYAGLNCPSMPEIGTGTGAYAGKWPHFPNMDFVNAALNNATASYGGGSINFGNPSGGAPTVQGVYENIQAAACTTSCQAYSLEWMEKLSGCNISPSDTFAIRQAFKNLCLSGCDSQNPTGSSTPNPSTDPTIQQILASFGYAESMLCTELLIDQPLPYGGLGSLMNKGAVPLDVCACDKLLKAYDDWPRTGMTYPEEVLYAQTGVAMDDIDHLICECNEAAGGNWEPGYQWPPGANSTLQGTGISVLSSLSCPESQGCTDCETVSLHLEDLLDRFGFDGKPTLEENYEEFSMSATSYMILTNYMNRELDFLLEYDNYADFIGGCLASSTEPYCTENKYFREVGAVMKLLSFRGQLTASSTLDLVSENIVYANSSLYKDNALGRYFTGNVSGNELVLTFSGESSCEIGFTLPSGASFGFDDIVSFGELIPLTTNCTNNSTFHLLVNYFSCGIIQTGILEGTTDCFNINLCVCGDTGQLLCNVPSDEIRTDCYSSVLEEMYISATESYQEAINEQYSTFKKEYNAKCAQAFQTENYSYTGPARIYQYTLFYYDQAGNLVKTVAPKGVDKLIGQDNAIHAAQQAVTGPGDTGTPSITPDHTYITSYDYNSYDQLVRTTNPDQDGATLFWYDRYGRIVASQNPEQSKRIAYSYTFYDQVGRPYEVGQTRTITELTDAILKADDLGLAFRNWANAGAQTEITKTFYDEAIGPWTHALFAGGVQENLRLRVASVLYYDMEGTLMSYVSATHYSYDLHGNVKEQIQDVPVLSPVQQDKKSTQYDYELISGTVKEVAYQKDKRDEQIHRYHYDELNRLLEVETTIDSNVHYDRQALYRYYDYGPLARVEYGQNQVQGQDYAYTVNGWMKGMNASVLKRDKDMGKDGTGGYLAGNVNAHSLFAKDVTAYTLSYFEKDYVPISGNRFEISYGTLGLNAYARNLYNGNIRSVVTSITGMTTMGKGFRYDQLNRLKEMTAYYYDNNLNDSWHGISSTQEYFNSYSYDKNGNITNLQRNGVTATGLLMDNFAYKYEETLNGGKNNRLSWVDDLAGTSVYADADIDNSMNAGNYAYDKLGQLVRDTDEGIAGIEWRLGDKKIKRITRNDANSSQLEFVYNPFGQRVLKIEKPRTGGAIQASTTWKYTYYTYDANGQVMAVYDVRIGSPFIQSAYLEEQHLYGASRLGMIKPHKPLHTGILGGTDVFSHTEGQTYYELANYLGNVEAVITDRKTWKLQGTEEIYFDQFTTPGDLLGWAPENPPFSANPPAVDYSLVALGGELIVYAGSTPAYWGTVFKQHFFEDGADYELSFDVDISGPGIYVTAGNATSNVFLNTVNSSGSYSFTFTGNGQMLWYGFICASGQVMKLDNIRLKKTESHAYEAVVVNTADYYPYGMVMPGRHTESVEYRFAYNGMETDKEVKGNGNSYTTEFRQYDPRLGRWLSLDPLKGKYPWMSPYVAFNNNPIFFIDPLGLEGGPAKEKLGFPTLETSPDVDNSNGGTGLQQQGYTTPLGKTPNASELSYYKFDTDKKQWWGVNDFRLKGDDKFKADMDNIAKAGMKIQSYITKKYGLDQSRLAEDITFGYSENEGEFASFKLNMIYVAKNGVRIPVSIPFGYHGKNEEGDNIIGPMTLSDIDNVLNTNCYALVLGVIGNINYEMDFMKAILGDGYRPITGKAKVGDIMVVGGSHAMKVSGINSRGELLYKSTNRGPYELMEGTLQEINEWQFDGGLLIYPDGKKAIITYYRK